MKFRSVFGSFSTPNLAGLRDKLCDSALKVGFSDVLRFSPEDYINTEFARSNNYILSQARGAGYWLWKPYLILKELKKLNEGDLFVYSDAGRLEYGNYCFSKFPSCLARMTFESPQGFLLGPALYQHGPLSKWTKRDCLIISGMDRPEVITRPTIQAGWSFWTHSDEAISFLEEWLKLCCDPRCLTDIDNTLGFDNYPDFVGHRHDQSILTLLAFKRGASFLDYSSTKLFRILGLRPKSALANLFLRRIDDAEMMSSGNGYYQLLKLFFANQCGRFNYKRIS